MYSKAVPRRVVVMHELRVLLDEASLPLDQVGPSLLQVLHMLPNITAPLLRSHEGLDRVNVSYAVQYIIAHDS